MITFIVKDGRGGITGRRASDWVSVQALHMLEFRQPGEQGGRGAFWEERPASRGHAAPRERENIIIIISVLGSGCGTGYGGKNLTALLMVNLL